MSSDAIKQFILPFQRDRNKQVEAGAILALAELERIKGGGLINKQVGEELRFVIKGGYPLWLYPRNGQVYLFDGLNNAGWAVCYPLVPSSQELKESLRAKAAVLENHIDCLSDYGNRFQNSQSNQFLIKGLINDLALRNEFTVYHYESIEFGDKTDSCHALFAPTISKKAIEDNFTTLDSLRLALQQESQQLSECINQVKQVTDQHKTELDFLLNATIEEANAKIQACEELINPQVDKINRKYKRKITGVTNTYNRKIKELENERNRVQKSVDKADGKISDYKIETERQAYRGHYYERRWAKKFARLDRELNGYTRKLDAVQSRLERVSNSKEEGISELNGELYSQTESLMQPLYQAQIEKSDRINAVRQKIQRLLELEGKLIDGINKTIGEWDLENSFQCHSLKEFSLVSPASVYVPFYLICYQSGESKRFLIISPSIFGTVDFSAKFKALFGVTKIRELLNPRFQAMTDLVGNVQELVKNESEFVKQLSAFANSHNLLKNTSFNRQAQEGFMQLKQEGWLSDRELQSLNRQLFTPR